jgi:Holliday junction resolvase RusA-like endonuclease
LSASRDPVPRTINDRWDLDNLVKPTLDAMEGIALRDLQQ